MVSVCLSIPGKLRETNKWAPTINPDIHASKKQLLSKGRTLGQ